MKFKTLAVAVSAAIVSNAAFALTPADLPADITINMSGASAQDKAITALVSDVCVAGTLHTYKDNAKGGKNYTNFFCNLDKTKVAVSNAALAPKMLFRKRSAGGSAQGVTPLITETAIDFMNETACSVDLVDPTVYNCIASGTGLSQIVPDAGVSDVNPEMFKGVNTPAGFIDISAADVATKLTVRGAAALVFGVPVTNHLYAALQEAKFGVASTCVTGPDGQLGDVSTLWDGNAANDDPLAADNYVYSTQAFTGTVAAGNQVFFNANNECMPSMNKRQIASIYAGQVEVWDDFMVGATPFTAAVSLGIRPTTPEVAICRRVNGSGTQAQANAVYLNNPCTPGALQPAAASGLFGPIVNQGSGSSNVNACLTDFAHGTGIQVTGNTSRAWAVGVQSTENNANGALDYRFIKVDGAAPTLENAWNGKYLEWVEQTFQWRKAGTAILSGDELIIVDQISGNASSPIVLATNAGLNPKYLHAFGQAGYMALVTNGHTPDANAFNPANPVIGYTHVANGGLDNCRVPVMNLDPALGTVDSQL